MTIRALVRPYEISPLSRSSGGLELPLSSYPICQGKPGSMNAATALTAEFHPPPLGLRTRGRFGANVIWHAAWDENVGQDIDHIRRAQLPSGSAAKALPMNSPIGRTPGCPWSSGRWSGDPILRCRRILANSIGSNPPCTVAMVVAEPIAPKQPTFRSPRPSCRCWSAPPTNATVILVLDRQAALWASVQRVAGAAGFGSNETRFVVRNDENQYRKRLATGISPHVLSHAAAPKMAGRGRPLWTVAKMPANSLPMIEKVYAKQTPDDYAPPSI